ncbi:MAG TPA: SDR family NAD(P)-dependent oxidoreductase [Trueperaceae bacterium]|nr:SDR family NAD(P)-dependent oxidoreductase [Trueperaceae bacterium]
MRAMHEMLSLVGERALVTGAASGIGRAVALRLAEAGAELVLVDRDDAGMCVTQGLVERVAGAGAVAREAVELGVREEIVSLWQRLEPVPSVLVNAAGSYPFAPFLAIDDSAYRAVMGVNLDAVFWMCQGMIRRRGSRGGSIVNIASVEALLPFKSDLAHYGSAKAGVIAFSRSLAREHGGHGFRVNVVVPGGIDTPGTRRAAREVLRLKLGRLIEGVDYSRRLPLRRLGTADEVACVVAFLASDAASYMVGSVVAVDGGFLSA